MKILRMKFTLLATLLLTPLTAMHAAGSLTYQVDPVAGNDANPPGKPWKTFGRVNAVKLAPGDRVPVSPGVQEETLKPSGEGTAENPVVIQFLPGVHTLNIKKVMRKQLFISNSIDSTEPIPVGIMLSQVTSFPALQSSPRLRQAGRSGAMALSGTSRRKQSLAASHGRVIVRLPDCSEWTLPFTSKPIPPVLEIPAPVLRSYGNPDPSPECPGNSKSRHW